MEGLHLRLSEVDPRLLLHHPEDHLQVGLLAPGPVSVQLPLYHLITFLLHFNRFHLRFSSFLLKVGGLLLNVNGLLLHLLNLNVDLLDILLMMLQQGAKGDAVVVKHFDDSGASFNQPVDSSIDGLLCLTFIDLHFVDVLFLRRLPGSFVRKIGQDGEVVLPDPQVLHAELLVGLLQPLRNLLGLVPHLHDDRRNVGVQGSLGSLQVLHKDLQGGEVDGRHGLQV